MSCCSVFFCFSGDLHQQQAYPRTCGLTVTVPVPVPGAELEAECSTVSCVPSMFSLFSACFFSVLVLEGSMGNRGKYGTMDEEEAVLPSSSATSARTKNQKGNSWNQDWQRKRKRKSGSLLQTQPGKKRYMTEKYIVYGFSFCSSLEVFRVRCFS